MKTLILLSIGIMFVMASCFSPNNIPTPPLDDCNWVHNGSFTFSELRLEHNEDEAPNLFMIDHPENPLEWGLSEVMDDNLFSSSDNATLRFTIIGSDCEGSSIKTYNNQNNGGGTGYGFTWISDAPRPSLSGFLCSTELEVKTAEYFNKICIWNIKHFIPVNSATAPHTGSKQGVWMYTSKHWFINHPREVYVTDQFNNYIYAP